MFEIFLLLRIYKDLSQHKGSLISDLGSTMANFYLLGLMAVSVLSEAYGDDYIMEGTYAKKNEFPWQGEISIKIISY